MRTSFVIPASNGIYLSPTYGGIINTLNNFNNEINFEFYNDAKLTIPSTGMTGSITINGKMSANSLWQNIPNTSSPSTVNVANAYSLQVSGVIYQLQIITNGITNTNFINVIVDSSKST